MHKFHAYTLKTQALHSVVSFVVFAVVSDKSNAFDL